ncbi:MAG: phosphoglycolate phosphatase [Pseudomonadota bacterium]
MNPTRLDRASFDAAIVDLDGTMVDTLGDFEVALAAALADVGCPPVTRDFIARTVGRGSEHLIRSALAQVGAPPALFDAAWVSYQHHYRAVNGLHSVPYPGVAQGLGALRAAGWRLACITNKPGAFASALLLAKGLAPLFEHVYGGDAFARRKPDPLPLLQACKALGTEPARTLVIGDSSNDAVAARAAGCRVVLVSYGYNHGEPAHAAGADAVIDRIDELPQRLAEPGWPRAGAATIAP